LLDLIASKLEDTFDSVLKRMASVAGGAGRSLFVISLINSNL